MRPIEKAAIPTDSNGMQIQLTRYQQSRGHLLVNLGAYCSYCERFLGGNIAVEHIQPKSKVSSLLLDWNNFLLACGNCNSIKKDKTISLNDYFWPDSDNTFRAFHYSFGAEISPEPTLSARELGMATNTIKLTGLDRKPSDDPMVNSEMTDRRWRERRTAMEKAERAKNTLMSGDTSSIRELIVDLATSTGFFSIWMTVFQNDLDMKRRLINAFPGTSTRCFDSNYNPVARPGGNV